MSFDQLNVIALISGGKDSFFSLLHCIHHGHRIVALANLFPVDGDGPAAVDGPQLVDPDGNEDGNSGEPSDQDLNSFMYQTVGHEVLPLYAAATGLPLYRQPIRGRAVRHERDYDSTNAVAASAAAAQASDGASHDDDETESMLPLLRAIQRRHPEANALCAGAILSTYQRTRVESIAMRLGLTPVAFLWQYPVLPPSGGGEADGGSETQLLRDMAAAGLEARIIKVASAGLDEDFLWARVSSEEGARRVSSALRKFGSSSEGGAASLGEGGEFETLVVDGPREIFRRRICVPEDGRTIVREGGGCSWLRLRQARLEEKMGQESAVQVRTPDLLDPRFKTVLDALTSEPMARFEPREFGLEKGSSLLKGRGETLSTGETDVFRWSILAEPSTAERSIQEETVEIVERTRDLLASVEAESSEITNTVVILRHMSDFPKVNGEYGKLFPKPNPPSRVTISCGDLLPTGRNIAVYLTLPSPRAGVDRNGLHVQSRSYWAPANIGPYSQAIDIKVLARQREVGFRSVAIAGQIPLIPDTMLLPSPSETSQELQTVLSLQHLWRIAVEMKVQYWSSAVAYFPRSTAAGESERNSQLAGLAWNRAFGSPEDVEDDATGPDPWDLKYNPQYMSLAPGGQEQSSHKLPDWSVLTLRQQNEPEACVPPVFAVEVEELPRQAAVEWHAHNGLSRLKESMVEMACFLNVGVPSWKAWNFVVRGDHSTMVYTTLACSADQNEGGPTWDELDASMRVAHRESLRRICPGELGNDTDTGKPHLVYVDTPVVDFPWEHTSRSNDWPAVVPCRSVWSPSGERLVLVALFETAFYDDNDTI